MSDTTLAASRSLNSSGTGRLARRKFYNGLFVGFCTATAVIALAALAAILFSLLTQGLGGLNLDIFTMSTPAAGSRGGLANAIVGSLMMCVLAMIAAVAIGVAAGTWLAEYGKESRYAQAIRFLNDVLLSAPSILVGLFVYYIMVAHGFKIVWSGFVPRFVSDNHYSGWAGAVALALIAAPVVTRTTEDVLKLQARALRESGVALGAPLWHTIRAILWRAASGGIVTGALLAFARVSGETAPLLFTSLSNQFFSWDMSQPMANLPVVIFNDALSAYDDLRRLAWVGALLITLAVLSINILVRVLARETRRS